MHTLLCDKCGEKTEPKPVCPKCGIEADGGNCPSCKGQTELFTRRSIPIRDYLNQAERKLALTVVPEGVTCVYEIVMNGLSLDAIKTGMKYGVTAAAMQPGVVKISSGNYGGKLGPFKAFLKDAIGAT
jgi:formylmethanofuran:tetrahydromethanopterin formyltransferase